VVLCARRVSDFRTVVETFVDQDARDGWQQLLNELDRVRHEYERLQEDNVHLQSECERLSQEAMKLQERSAESGDAQVDADRDWRLHSGHGHRQQRSLMSSATSSIDVVTEGFILPHDVEQLQERVRELERMNHLLRSARRSPTPSGSDQDLSEGGFIDKKLRREATQTTTRTVALELFVHDSPTDRASPLLPHDDGDQSPVPSPDGASGFAESHSPAYERLRAEFVAYKQKAQKDYTKLKARLVSTVREYNELKSNCALGKSPSPSPVLRSPVSPVADILVLQSAVGKLSVSDRHCKEKGVQTDSDGVSAADSRAVEDVVDLQPSEVIRDIHPSEAGGETDTAASVRDRCVALEKELSVLRSQYSAEVEQNRSLSERVASLQEAADKPQPPGIAEMPSDGFTLAAASDAAGASYLDLIAENQRLRQARQLDQSEYEEKLRRLEDRCLQENSRLKQLLAAVRTDRRDDVGDGDLSTSCRHCAELAEKCRMLETSVELSGVVAERRLHEVEESREIAADLQSRLHRLSEDDGNVVSEACCSSVNSLFGYVVVDGRVVTNISVADRQGTVCGGVIADNTVKLDRNALGIVDHMSDDRFACLPGNDVDLEVARILEHSCENAVNDDLELTKTIADNNLNSCSNLHEGLIDGDHEISYGCMHSEEVASTVSLQAQYETTAILERSQSVDAACVSENETECSGNYLEASGQQQLGTESPVAVQQESASQPFASVKTIIVKRQPQMFASPLEKTVPEIMPHVTSTKSASVQMKSGSGRESEGIGRNVKNIDSCRLEKQPRCSSLPNILKPCSYKHSDTFTSQIESNEREKAEAVLKSACPSEVMSSAAVLENVSRLASQNEEMLRHNRAWTDRLKREYAAAADELRTVKSKYRTIVCEKEKVQTQLSLAQRDIRSNSCELRVENVISGPAHFSDTASSSRCCEKLDADAAAMPSSQASEDEELPSVTAAAVFSETSPAAIDSNQNWVHTTRTQSSRSLPIVPQDIAEVRPLMMNAACSNRETTQLAAGLSFGVHLELELLRLEKKELCASLETEERKSAELQQQYSELASSMKQLEDQFSEVEGQLNDAKIQLEIVFEEKREMCRRCEELSAELESSGMMQAECDGVMQDSTLIADNSIYADAISGVTENILPEDVMTKDVDVSLSACAGGQQSNLTILELEAALECITEEKLALQKELECCKKEHCHVLQNLEQLNEQLDASTRSNEDGLHVARNKVQELVAANSAFEITNMSLASELDALKSLCSGLQDDASRLSDEAASLQLELESVNNDKELMSQCHDELVSQMKAVQQRVEFLEEENARFQATVQSVNEQNERLSVEMADVGREFELLSEEKEKLSASNSAVESAKCLLEEQCGELTEKLQQLELAETKTKQQYSVDLQNVRSALEHKQRECSRLLEEVEAGKLSYELNALKLHDSLKCSEQQREQLSKAQAVVRDLEQRLCDRENEVISATDSHSAALAALDETTSQLVSLQRENETISAALCETRAEKDQLLTESKSKVEALETELLANASDISSLREKVSQMEAVNEQLMNELLTVNMALHEAQHQAQEEKVFCEKQLKHREEECESLKVTCDGHLAELEKMTLKCTSVELQLSSLRTDNNDVVQELQEASGAVRHRQDLVNSVSSEYQQYKDHAEQQLKEVRALCDRLAGNHAECQQEKKIVEEKLYRLTGELESCEREMAALVAEIDIFRQSNDELKSRIASSQKNEESLAGELEELRTKYTECCALHRTEIDEQKQMLLQADEERDRMCRIHEQSCQVIDETIAKYKEVEGQLVQLRHSNDMLANDLDRSNQRCKAVSDDNERLLSENRELADSLAIKTAEIGLLVAENEAVETRSVKQSSELQSLSDQHAELISKKSALLEENKELKSTNSQLLSELEQNQHLLQKLGDTCKYAEDIKSELDGLKTAHRQVLDREEMLSEENRLLITSRDEMSTTLQSELQKHHLEFQDLTSQITEMEALLCASRDEISSLQLQKEDVESFCKVLHDCIENCISEALRDVMAVDAEAEFEDTMHQEMNDNDVEKLKWLQVQITRKNNKLQSLRDELITCRGCLISEQSLRSVDNESLQKLSEECEQLKDELTAARGQCDECREQHAAAVGQLSEIKHDNEQLSEENRTVSDLYSSSQQNVIVLTDEVTTLKLTLNQLEDKNVEMEMCWKMRDSELAALMDSYNVVAAERNALEAESRSLSSQLETLQKEMLDLSTQLKMASVSNSTLEEKLSQALGDLQQSSQECSERRVKVAELEENLSRQDFQNKEIASLLEQDKTLFDAIFRAITSISQKCQSDYPDVASTQEVDTLHAEYADDSLNRYPDVLHHLDLFSNCYERMTEERNLQKGRICALVEECDFLKAQASVDVSVDVGLQELQDEVVRIFQAKTDLENELMQLRAENMEAKDTQDRREAEMSAEREVWEQKVADLRRLLDMASQSKEALETELLCERNEFERNLAAARCESLLRAGRSEEEQRRIVEQLSDAESQLGGLRDRLRASQDERDLLQLRLAYVARECSVKDQHREDLLAQLAAQRAHVEESLKEHRETVQLLVELRLEQQLGRREQRGEFSRLEEEILRLESHIGSCSSRVSTPQTDSVVDAAPVSRRPSSVQSLPPDSASKIPADESDRGPAADDLAYKALQMNHFQLVQELSQLRHQLLDLQDAHKCLTDDNVMLKQHVELKTAPLESSDPGSTASLFNIHEHRSSVDFLRAPHRAQSCEQFSSVGSSTSLASFSQRGVCFNIPVEMVSLQAKLVRVQKHNQELVDENKELRTGLSAKQDELMKQMEAVREKQKKRSFRFGSSHENVAAVTELSEQQIQLLQQERDELRCRLDAERVREDAAAELRDQVQQLEDALSKERQKFYELYREKESVEIQLMQERLTVEKHVREFQRLRGLLSKKDRLDEQLHKTSSATCPDSSTSAGTRQLLQDKKQQLVVEIRRKILYRDVAVQVGESSLRSVRRTQATSVQPLATRVPPMSAERSLRLDCGCVTELGTMRMRTGCRYHQAVERLRRELKAQDAAARKAQSGLTGKHAGTR